eukprot:TRINITY_DN4235_c0_g1_i1.p1 TRINITY_DN4235_c0_g1~~TRINITY_DN4235_c0_g1_i1.p1  ORF type:complete len:377 (+),score=88.03 TRINITY_DN4235_c0_g1_i1:126-1256(+)
MSMLARELSQGSLGHEPRRSLLSEQLAGVRITDIDPTPEPDSQAYSADVRQGLDEGRAILKTYLQKRIVYSLMPESGKVVVLDEDLKIKNAFEALGEHDITSTLLWDSKIQDYVGILSISDFIEVLLHLHNASPHADLESQKIREWRERTGRNHPLISIQPEGDLFQAMQQLVEHRVHRLPIVHQSERNDVLYIITHVSILWDIINNFREELTLLRYTIEEINIGTFGGVVTVLYDTPLVNVLHMLMERHISALPIVDETGVVIDVYSKSDVVLLAQEKVYDIGITVKQALSKRPQQGAAVVPTCRKTDSLKTVLERLAATNVHRLICVDGQGHVLGIVSLHDIFEFLIGAHTAPVARGSIVPSVAHQATPTTGSG